MMRPSMAVIAGLIVWMAVATALDVLVRVLLSGYHTAEASMQFTLPMMIARLALPGAIPSLAGGWVSAWIAPGNRWVTRVLIVILLAVFLPSHYMLFDKFPLWYHVTFLASLMLLTWCGARLAPVPSRHMLPKPAVHA